VLEVLFHVSRDTVPADRILIPVDVPDSLLAEAARPPSERNLPLDPPHPVVRRIKLRTPESFAFDRRLPR